MEFLLSEGHLETDLLNSSPEKLRWLHKLALDRLTKQQASLDHRQLWVIYHAVGGLMDKKGQQRYKAFERELIKVQAGPVVQNQAANLQELTRRAARLGAKIKTKQ